jgi:hypothetical protein
VGQEFTPILAIEDFRLKTTWKISSMNQTQNYDHSILNVTKEIMPYIYQHSTDIIRSIAIHVVKLSYFG